jgi:uncharacterized SAM-binding protein YcdF (DUF218 family)
MVFYIIWTIFIVLLIFVCFILAFPRILYGKLNFNNNRKSDVIIILGYPILNNGDASPLLMERIKKGIELYKSNTAGKIICTGSAVKNEYIEAEIMYKELIKAGIPKEDIICEKESKGTWDNIKYVKKIMEENKMETGIIVTNIGHLRKASIYAKEFGLNFTVEKSNIPKDIPKISYVLVYIYLYHGILKYIINKKKYKK